MNKLAVKLTAAVGKFETNYKETLNEEILIKIQLIRFMILVQISSTSWMKFIRCK